MMICYSMLCCLWDRGEADSPDKFTRLVGMTPIQRLAHIAAKHELTDLFGQLAAEYEWFLANTDREKLSARQWIADNKNDVRRRDATFGNVIYALLQQVATKTGQDLRYLVV